MSSETSKKITNSDALASATVASLDVQSITSGGVTQVNFSPTNFVQKKVVCAEMTAGTSTQSVSTGIDTLVNFASGVITYSTGVVPTLSTHRLTVPVSGVYAVHGRITLSSHTSGAGEFTLILYVNGSWNRIMFSRNRQSTISQVLPFFTTVNLTANDYITVYVYQASGSACNINSSSSSRNTLGCTLLTTL